MMKLRAMAPSDVGQVIALLEAFHDEIPGYRLLTTLRQGLAPLQAASMALPPAWQFTPAIFTAVEADRVLCALGLSKDPDLAARWKIDQLVLAPEASAYDVGAPLVNYALSRYGAAGAESFVALAHPRYEQALGLLKACGFRPLARQETYYHERPGDHDWPQTPIKGLREAVCGDARALRMLNDQTLPVEKRLFLTRSESSFRWTLFQGARQAIRGGFYKRWVVADATRDLLLGSVSVYSQDLQVFEADVIVSPGWPEGDGTLLDFALSHITGQTRRASVTVTAYDFQDRRSAALRLRGFHPVEERLALGRDSWTPLETTPQRRGAPTLIFSRKASTAFSPDSR